MSVRHAIFGANIARADVPSLRRIVLIAAMATTNLSLGFNVRGAIVLTACGWFVSEIVVLTYRRDSLRAYAKPRHFSPFVVVAGVIVPAASATFVRFALTPFEINGGVDWISWSLINACSLLVFMPVMLAIEARQVVRILRSWRCLAALLLANAGTAFGMVVFASDRSEQLGLQFAIVSFIARSFGVTATSVTLLTINVLVVACGLRGLGPLAGAIAAPALTDLLSFEVTMAIVVATTLAVAASFQERDERLGVQRLRASVDRTYAEQLHALSVVASEDTLHRSDRIDAVLRICMDVLNLRWAYYGQFDLDRRVTRISTSVGAIIELGIPIDVEVPFDQSLIGRYFDSHQLVIFEDVSEMQPPERGFACYRNWDRYIASVLWVNGEPYGSIGFVGSEKSVTPFSISDRRFVELTATLIARGLERGLYQQELQQAAFHDRLTGLPNRAAFDQKLASAIHCAKAIRPFALLLIDIDSFKNVNDRFGHGVGDELLQLAGSRLTNLLEGDDVLARIGGDEFAAILYGVREIGDLRRRAMSAVVDMRRPFAISTDTVDVTISVGACFCPQNGSNAKELLRSSDQALYLAKQSGKDAFVQFDPVEASANGSAT